MVGNGVKATAGSTRSGRDALVEYIQRSLIGPRDGEEEQFEGRPLLRYMMGMLYPRDADSAKLRDEVAAGADEDGGAVTAVGEEEAADAPVGGTNDAAQSALSISFLVSRGTRVQCEVSAARYESHAPAEGKGSGQRDKSKEKWTRHPLPANARHERVVLSKSAPSQKVLGELAALESRWRSRGDAELVTVTIQNLQQGASNDAARVLFQVELRCRVLDGTVLPYPVPRNIPDAARRAEEYLYRATVPYARGHGCAAEWKVDGTEVREVWASFIPTVDVPLAEFTLPKDTAGIDPLVFDLEFLAQLEHDRAPVLNALKAFTATYRTWIDREAEAASAAGELEAAPLASVVRQWATRMEKGLELLVREPRARLAFAAANRAMGMQMILSRNLRRLADAGLQLSPDEDVAPPAVTHLSGLKWRPFQLAFFLGLIESLWTEDVPERLDVDVIWFPTGGGKTEAYLLVAAFELIRRRLVNGGRDDATAILSRYTLRMLTAQQFQRTAALFIALELVRRDRSAVLGDRPFSLGLWVGGSLTPNRFSEAEEKLDDLQKGTTGQNPFLLDRCPRCGTSIFHPAVDKWHKWGVKASPSHFSLYCPRRGCEFATELPLNIVDDALYASPPSMLIGTVDKFANLAWDERASAFFGAKSAGAMPPSLLIQDELHLIAGPLGTLDAMYEAAIEEIIRARGGGRPKIIGSTATIRNAADQVRGLYARKCYVFPSPIRRWDDAFFFRSNPEGTRRYVGVMSQGYVKPVVALVWTAATLLQGAQDAEMTPEERDAYWTLVAYHNSRRELGRTMTATRDEIPARAGVLAPADDAVRPIERILQLSANGPVPIDEAIRQLEASMGSESGALDVVPCTSIMSVGIDINRLGLMLVNGQPKLVAEYIQATSRVGRGDVEGLIVTLFSPLKPRDRSHYEDFKSFHENLYRYVEPTSVTPLSPPARRRTLHAAIVSAVRHATQWSRNDGAKGADLSHPIVSRFISGFLERVALISDDPAADTEEVSNELHAFLDSWADQQDSNLVYDASSLGPAWLGLIKPYGEERGSGRPTMRSMRHVDTEVTLRPFIGRGA